MGGHGKDKERRHSRQANYEDEQEHAGSSSAKVRQACTLHAEDLVPKYSGQDKTQTAARWALDIEDNAEIFEWTPLQTLVVARRSLTGTAALWLKSERPFKCWDDLKAALLKEFPDTIDSKAIHEMMSSRKKRKDERCIDYMLTMKEMGKRGKMPDYVAIKYIIDGIVDNENYKLMLYGATAYPELKEKIKVYETIKEKMKKTSGDKCDQKTGSVSTGKSGTHRCYNCGEKDHLSSACPNKEKGSKCFKCNEFGHISTQCKQNIICEKEKSDERANRRSGGSGGSPNASGNRRAMCVADFTPFNMCEVGQLDSLSDVRGMSTNESDDSGDTHKMAEQSTRTDADFTDVYDKKRTPAQIRFENACKTIIVHQCVVNALIDSGSEVNLMSRELYTHIGSPKSDVTNTTLSGLGCSKVMSTVKFTTSIELDGHSYSVLFYVIPRDTMPCSVILGQDFLKDVFAIMSKGSVLIAPNADNWLGKISLVCHNQFVLGDIQNEEVKREVIQCVESYNPVQIKEAPIELRIVLKDDILVAQRPRRLSLAEQQLVDEQVSEWLKDGIIRVSYSEYSSPLVLIKKKDGGTRVCVDYRPINKKMVKDEFPLPIIDDLIDKLKDARVFSVLDLKNGFFHLRISEESIKYTSFVTHNGQYEFLRAPFGLSVCPKYFMRFVTMVFHELIAKGVLVIFVDDLLIQAHDEFQAVERLKQVLTVASQYGLQINWKKAQLLCRRIEYLGHIIEDGKVQPSKEKTEAVTRYPEPKSLKQLHSFVGLTSYFRKYVKDYAVIAKPLTDLLKKDVNFVFDDVQRNSFNILKDALACSPVLRIYDPQMDTELHTDASAIAYSAILFQKDYKGELHPVHYFSRKTSEAEKKYSSYELEALAIIEGVKKFRHYLYGKHFKIVTDCQAFQKTLTKKDLTTRVARWVLLLEEYDYVIEHRPGNKMPHADALSRNPYVGTIELNLHEQIKQAQALDEGIRAIIEVLKFQTYEDYTYNDGLLYKGIERRLVIPKNLEAEILKRVHEKGHFGKRKMLQILERDYYIKNVSKKIDEFLVTCIPCLLATKKEGKQEGFLNSIDKESIPLHTIHCDHIGPLSETRKLYNYILTVVDAFTKFVWLFPVKGTTSKETIEKLLIHQQTFGNPVRLISDRGTAFTSNDFKEYCQQENIQHITITTGVPRGNGQVERMHRIIIAVLTKLCIADPCQWYKHVSRVQRALNSTYQRSIDTTPFELLVGTKMNNSEDIAIYDLIQQEHQKNFIQNREELKIKAKEQIRKIQDENSKTYNKKRKESRKYAVGDIVAIKRTQFGTGLKLRPKYLGPYRVTKVKRKDRYDVEKIDPMAEGSRFTSTSADHMKPWPVIGDTMGLGVDDTHKFLGNETHTDYFRLLLRDGNYLLVGGRNVVYNLSLTDLTEQRRLVWYSPENDVKMCVVKGKDEESCQNYIRVLVSLGTGRLLVCGTNSFKPFCREYSVQRDSYHMEREKSGQAVCPYDPEHNSTAVYADGELYSGTVADFSGMEPIIYREPLQTEPYDSMTLNAPDFVNSLVHGNFVYFFFRETAVEYINCGKAVYSRVARVCRDDRGGPHRFKQRWTSFLKSRLNCSVAGDFPFYFNEIQSTTELIEGVYGGLNAQLIYGTFTTPPNSISGSAVCAFSMQDIADTFEGTFKEQSAINSNWLPVNSAKVPEPRPGTCNNDSRQLPDQTLNFIKTHALMDESVPAFFGEPIVIRTSFHYRFTQIAVDPQVKTPGGKAYDVLFIGTDNGKIIKAINAVSYDSNKRAVPVVIEELQAFAAGSPVRALRVARAGRDAARLIAVSDRQVLSLRLHRCSSDKISSCSECVALQDPYCAWDKQAGRCRAFSHGVSRWLDENSFYQSVSTGSHAACPHSKDAGAVGGLSSGLYDDARGETKGEVINIVQDKDGKGGGNGNEGPEVLAADPPPAAYSVETLALAVAAGALAALGAGFAAGYICGRRCKKDDDDNMPYPDTEYEYFEQRQNINRIQAEPKLLQQVEEVTYAEPVLAPQPKPASPRATLRKHPPYHPHHETLFQFQPDAYRRDNFGTLRSHQGDGYRRGNDNGFSTTRSVKKVYL